jgi:hypothetical protein
VSYRRRPGEGIRIGQMKEDRQHLKKDEVRLKRDSFVCSLPRIPRAKLVAHKLEEV